MNLLIILEIEKIKQNQENNRYKKIYNDALGKIEEKEIDANKELKEAKKELDSAKKKLDSSKKTLDSTKKQLSTFKTELDKGYKQLTSGKQQYEKYLQENNVETLELCDVLDIKTINENEHEIICKHKGKDITFKDAIVDIDTRNSQIKYLIFAPLCVTANNTTIENVNFTGSFDITRIPECEKSIITDKFCYQELENVEISEDSTILFKNEFN